MRYQELFENENEAKIKDIFYKIFNTMGEIIVNPDNSVYVRGFCILKKKDIFRFPIDFDVVEGNFECNNSNLTSLVGGPSVVQGVYSCNDNKLTSLIGAPDYVGWNFYCVNNTLKSLEGFPKELEGVFHCTWRDNLPLLRALTAKGGVMIQVRHDRSIHTITDIINKYKGHTNLRHAILDLTRDLVAAGFEGNAKW